jgi:hypothetical protein
MYEILIQNGSTVYSPAIKDGVEFLTERKGVPSKLTFTCLADDTLQIEEGNVVSFREDGTERFYGYIFTISRDKSEEISVTAYDKLRYFKNKATYVYENKKASDVLRMIASDYTITLGTVEDTYYTIPSMVEDTQELFDIMQNALDEELKNSGILFVLYDDCGSICLQNFENMLVQILIDEETGQNFDYKSTIDSDTYNQIKLTYDNEDTGKREVYIAKDSSTISKWGLLEYCDTLQEGENGVSKADALLKLYNAKSKSLKVTGCAGDSRVRAGCCVVVRLDLGDLKLDNVMLVEKCTQKYKEGYHTMDLTLKGAEINASE